MLSPKRAVQLKAAGIRYAQKHSIAIPPGARAYRRVLGVVIPVPTIGRPYRELIRRLERYLHLEVTGTFTSKLQAILLPPPPGADVRRAYVAELRWMIANEPSIHYSMRRPIDGTRRTKHALPLFIDCSGSLTLAAQWAGAPDPNGRGFDGLGYTGTLLAHGHEIRRDQLRAGDLIIWGDGTGDHVAAALEDGWNPSCFSHGMERGPLTVDLDTETRIQRSIHGNESVRYVRFLP